MERATIADLRASLSQFVELGGRSNWSKRIAHLRHEVRASPFRAKLAADYNWLELVVANLNESASLHRAGESLEVCELASLYFADTVVRAHRQLTPNGKRQLDGRLRDSLQSRTGFSSLYLEMDVARRLFDAGYDVEFTDLDGTGRCDLRFWKGALHGEVECKSLSTDSGRKIHRHEFYRYMDAVSPSLTARLRAPVREIILVTLDGRMPADDTRQRELRSATTRILQDGEIQLVNGSFFSISRDAYDRALCCDTSPETQDELHTRCRATYGDNCHVSGGFVDDSCCLIVVRSQQEDDHSAPQLEALKKAASQCSGTGPAFIAVQYDDLTAKDLVLHRVRRRAALLSNYLFLNSGGSHVVATRFSAYGGLATAQGAIGVPAFGVPNPQSRFSVHPDEYPPFLSSIPDEEFARIVGAPIPTSSISSISIDHGEDRLS